MKEHLHVLGIDDGPFSFTDEKCDIVGVLMEPSREIKAVMHASVDVDGIDSTAVVTDMVLSSRYREEIRCIMTDGIAFGGFNILDIGEIYRITGIPVMTVTRHRPDLGSMKEALLAHHRNWEERYSLIEKYEIYEVPVRLHGGDHTVFINTAGLDLPEAKALLRKFIHRTLIPEPIRVAHLIGSALKTGESRGHP